MAKEAFYFPHDFGARNDPKLQKVLMKLGQAGKGVYWDLVEMMFEEDGYLLLSECESYAFALRTDVLCINSLINDFDLFKKDAVKFWSDSIHRRIDKRNEKSKKASISAQSRWAHANALKNDANALQQECESNAIKEKKGKETDSPIVDVAVPTEPAPIKKSFKERKELFRLSLYEFTRYSKNPNGKYDPEMVKDFFEHWTEPSTSGKKMKFELGKTWSTAHRLSTWEKNSVKFNPKPKNYHSQLNFDSVGN